MATTQGGGVADRPTVTVVDLRPHDVARLQQAAALLVAAFADWPNAYPDIESANAQVLVSLTEERISLIALEDRDTVVGWIGGMPEYDGIAWQLHPLAVRPDRQGRGVGRALVAALEDRVRERGGTTIYLGTDDEDNRTSLGGIDLYPNVWEHIAQIQNLGNHPYSFYLRCGYAITGVIPDANGFGKPDILMARRL
jgi:aminoglycoside 6'-N-acetyltransferase I